MKKTNYFTDGEGFDRWNVNREEYKTHPLSLDYLLKHQNAKEIFEIGIGTGLFAEKMVELGFEVEGIDKSKPLVDHLKKKGLTIKVDVAPLEDYIFKKKYDAIYSFEGPLLILDTQKGLILESYLEEPIEGQHKGIEIALKKIKNALIPYGNLCICKIPLPTRFEVDNEVVLVDNEFKDDVLIRTLNWYVDGKYQGKQVRKKIAIDYEKFSEIAKKSGFTHIVHSWDGKWLCLL